jgi:hypothetical protein
MVRDLRRVTAVGTNLTEIFSDFSSYVAPSKCPYRDRSFDLDRAVYSCLFQHPIVPVKKRMMPLLIKYSLPDTSLHIHLPYCLHMHLGILILMQVMVMDRWICICICTCIKKEVVPLLILSLDPQIRLIMGYIYIITKIMIIQWLGEVVCHINYFVLS